MNNKDVRYEIKNNNSSLGIEILDFDYNDIFDEKRSFCYQQESACKTIS